MFLPIKRPNDLRFRLSRLGIDAGDEDGVIRGYGCLRLLQHIVEKKGWKIPFAAYKNADVQRILTSIFPETMESFNKVFGTTGFYKNFSDAYSEVAQINIDDFIKNVCPNFVADPKACIQISSGQINYRPELHVIFIWSIQEGEVEKAYAVYCDLVMRALLSTPLPLEKFSLLYQSINCFSLSTVIKSSSNASRASAIFNQMSIPRNLQVDLYRQIHDARYMRTNIFEHIKRSKGSDSFLFDSMTAFETEFNQAAKLLRKVEPSAFLEALDTDAQIENEMKSAVRREGGLKKTRRRKNEVPDAVTESSFVYSRFLNYVEAADAKKVLIINPSMPFIKKWAEGDLLKDVEAYFMLEWDSSVALLESEFSAKNSHCHFVVHSEFDFSEKYDAALLFYRNFRDYINGQRHLDFGKKLLNLLCCKRLFWLLPDENAKEIFKELYEQGTSDKNSIIEAVDILPTEIFRSEPLKKVFLQAAIDVDRDTINLTGYYSITDPSLGILLYPIKKNIRTTLKSLTGNDTIRTIYRNEGIITRQERERKLPLFYQFAPELKIWYTISYPPDALTPKVKAYLCEYPTEEQEKNVLKRGKEIKSAHKWKTNYPKDWITGWIEEEAVYKPEIRQAAVKMIQARYKQNAPVSLKIFWYLYGIDHISEGGFAVKHFICSAHGAELKVGQSTREDYIEAVDCFFKEELSPYESETQDEMLCYVWDFLCNLLDIAVEKGYEKVNPLEDLVSRVRNRHSEFHELRAALTKKTFTLDEELRLLELIRGDDSPLALGVMIRLYTGMPANQVCALRYQDFKGIPHVDGYQFLVYEKITGAGSAPKALSRPEEYRRIPVAPILAEYIDRHIQSIESKVQIKVKDTDYFLVSGDLLDGKIPEKPKPFAPSTLQKHCKQLISGIGIEHVNLMIPDEETGSKESDFTKYESDIFRTNLRYRLKNTCNFTNSECDYVLGVQMQNTFAKHYCDYTNPFAQSVMLTKLMWWCAQHKPCEQLPHCRKVSQRNLHLKIDPIGSRCASAALALTVLPEADSVPADMTITVNSPNGWDGSMSLIEAGEELDG